MTSTTPIYGIPYPDASDLVSNAPAQLKDLAAGMETALQVVDNRSTPAGVKPVIATTLAALADLSGVTGQTGYVTADTTASNNGAYVWNGSAWTRFDTPTTPVTTLINSTYGTVRGYKNGSMVTLRIDWKSSNAASWGTGTIGTLPAGWRPPMEINPTFGGRDDSNQKQIIVKADGSMSYSNMGGAQSSNGFGLTFSYGVA